MRLTTFWSYLTYLLYVVRLRSHWNTSSLRQRPTFSGLFATEPTLSIGPDLTLTCLRGRKDKSHHDMVTVPRSQGFGREWVVTQVTPRPGL